MQELLYKFSKPLHERQLLEFAPLQVKQLALQSKQVWLDTYVVDAHEPMH